jgi:hypothetical protein
MFDNDQRWQPERLQSRQRDGRSMHSRIIDIKWKNLMDRTREMHLRRDQLSDQLLPQLVGRAFHVTCSLPLIRETAEIRPNHDGQLPASPFGSTNSYFRNRGYVSVFDYRFARSDQIDLSLGKCSVLTIARRGSFACLFLSEAACSRLIPYTKEQMLLGKVVPHVEGGHPGPIPMSDIEEILQVTVEPDFWDARVERMRQARKRGG